MRYLHTMVRVKDLDSSLDFYTRIFGLTEVAPHRKREGPLHTGVSGSPEDVEAGTNLKAPLLELTYNWDTEDYTGGRNFGHLAYEVDNIYEFCQQLADKGVTINRPRATATWRSSSHLMVSLSSCCRRARLWSLLSRGSPCPIPAAGNRTAVERVA